MTILTKENAHTAATVRNIIFPEWGIKRFQHEVQQGAYGEKYAVVGSGVNSAVIPSDEFHLWEIISQKEVAA